MQVVYLNGRRLQLTWRELQTQFRHPYFVGMMLMMALVIVLIGPYDHLLNFTALRLTIFYAACFGSFSALLYFSLWLCHRLNWKAYSLFTVGLSGLGATLCGLLMALLLGADMPSFKDMLLVTGFNLVFCYLGETIQSTYIIPRIMADLRGRPAQDMLVEFIASEAGTLPSAAPVLPAAPDLPATVTLFGRCFPTASLQLIEAEEHYVAILLKDGTRHLLRGRIADAESVLPPGLGLRVHRSYWVAASAVAAFRADKPGAQLLLTSGISVPVARPRLPEVRHWAETLPAKAPPPSAPKQKAPQRVPSAGF
ncbi:LytTR family DNA-binding domain-containing protein [Pseudotabrizicola algicola]|uniref:LytTR family transcriptional regulator n=1 Tax=Pseudotabrizicola algicola TaxID=2709381 RepID=A0A6B3RSF4_9RHOB|nr:LytTR family DNA-binding domain-containing protein [Pseudotabrizicola algicola]NEX46049.1 LytTR family transcriptional regulator [Pseudotabrizicola algicola]